MKGHNLPHLFLPLVLITLAKDYCISGAYGDSADMDLTLTASQKVTLDKFKSVMIPSLEQDYMKTDVYLLKWLRAANFDVKRAESKLKEDIEWRRMNNIDSILNEDWSDFEREMGYDISGVDKEGRPILYYRFGEWNVRRAIITGKRDKMMRYLALSFELANLAVRKKQEEGKEVTRAIFIANIDGFSLTESACLQCVLIYGEVFRLQSHYPGLVDKLYVVNTPGTFQIILNLATSILRGGLLQVYGSNKQEIKTALLETIDADQLPIELGGNKIVPF